MPMRPAKSWSSTLRLPKSTFPPRTSSTDRAKYLKRCTDDLYAWQARMRTGVAPFILHDGPPYANGSLHIGHALNKILKDLICRSELHQGREIRFVPGWDCHGLPIEIKALEAQQKQSNSPRVDKLDPIAIRRAARSLAAKTVQEQKKSFRKWAVMADWDNAWTTMDKSFEMRQLKVFQDMAKRGIIFRRYKPVYWSPSSRTALAEAELEYKDDHESTAAFVKFPISIIPQELYNCGIKVENFSALVWTTTPWTLPANRAIAIHPDLEYVVFQKGVEQLLVSTSRLEHVMKCCSLDSSKTKIIAQIKGSELEGIKYINMLQGTTSKPQPLIFADFVSAESGTGLVHCAPGHGMEDYDACLKLGISAFAPVDDAGRFTDAAFPDNPAELAGELVLQNGSAKVIALLGDSILAIHKYKHKYPYDWRTKLPVIVRATEQWFADVGSIKDMALASLEEVDFIPKTGKSRLESFVRGRSEWCISRQRAWGVPIPALYDENGQAILTEESVAHIIRNIGERGSDAWWTDAEDDPAWVAPGLQGFFRRGKDTMDVWFDSGTSWTQTKEQADVYCEGTDQHRGWFQSSLLTSISTSGTALSPFRRLVTHGFTLDQDGKKMSKSIGNVIEPQEIMDGTLLPPIKRKGKATGAPEFDALGPDALRLWAASSDYTRDVVIGEPVLKATYTSLLKYRTTVKMLLGSMHQEALSAPLTALDKIALVQLDRAMVSVWEAWQTYEFHKAVSIINRWVNVDLSSFYLEGVKDRLYCGDGGGVLYHAFYGLLKMLAPITPMLVEEAWAHRPEWIRNDIMHLHPLQQVLFSTQPLGIPRSEYESIEHDIPLLLAANTAIKTAQEEARARKLIGSSLQSTVLLQVPHAVKTVFAKYDDDLEGVFVVSGVRIVELKDEVSTTSADASPSADRSSGPNIGSDIGEWRFSAEFDIPGENGRKGIAHVMPPQDAKCPRCWRYVAAKEEELCGRCENIVSPDTASS